MRTDEQRAAHAAYMREWRQTNTADQHERNRELHRQWYAERREERIEANRAWRKANPEKAAAVDRANNRRRHIGRDQAAVDFSYIALGDPCSYCSGDSDNVDHIDAASAGGSNDWTNLTGACASCNFAKHTTPMLHFLLANRRP